MQKKLLSLLSKFSGNIAVGKCLFAWQLHKRNSPWKLYNQMSGARAFDTAKGMSCKTVLMQSQCAMCTVQPAYLCSSFFCIYIFVENRSFDFRWASTIRQSFWMSYTNQMRGIPNSQSQQLTKRPGLLKWYYSKSNKKRNIVRKMCVQMQCARILV